MKAYTIMKETYSRRRQSEHNKLFYDNKRVARYKKLVFKAIVEKDDNRMIYYLQRLEKATVDRETAKALCNYYDSLIFTKEYK